MMASPAKAITNREPDNGRHPYVGLGVSRHRLGQPSHQCSASLLSPTVVLTVGHCTDGTAVARVWFAENVQNNSEYRSAERPPTGVSPTPTPTSASGAERAPGFA
jgi:V8-like Glu-specific endopeptidase